MAQIQSYSPTSTPPSTELVNVMLCCTGVGIMNRGIESFFRDCFDGLHPFAEAAGVRLTLLKGRGEDGIDEHRVWCLPRTHWLAEGLGKLVNRNGYVIEQLSSLPAICRQIRKIRPDVFLYSDVNMVMQLKKRRPGLGVPFRLVYSNGAPMHGPFAGIEYVQQVAPLYLQEAFASGTSADKQSLVPYGIIVPQGSPEADPALVTNLRRQLHLPLDRKIVISVGWISAYHKRMDYVVHEVAALPEPRPYLVLLGAMDERSPEIIALAKEKLGEANFTARSVPYEQVPQYYQAADVFTLASLKEGFGRVYLEALMYGLPCVVHDYPVMRYVLGEEGTFADLSKPGVQAGKLAELLNQPRDPAAMARRRESVRSRFGWKALAPLYFEMFRKAAKAPLVP